MSAPLLDGPRILPAGPPRALVVLLHGYGANGADLIALGDAWRATLPEAAFVAPDAPETIPGHWGGLQWFELAYRDDAAYVRGLQSVQPRLEAFLAAELARHGLAPDRLALVGFSQGAMLALHVGLRLAVPPAALVGLSGRLAGSEELLAREIVSRPPTLLIHGSDDDLIPVAALHAARESLAAAGVPLEWHEQPGLGHGIDAAGLARAGAFLRRVL